MSNSFIRDLTIGSSDARQARRLKGLENAAAVPATAMRPREIVGGVLGGGAKWPSTNAAYTVTKEEGGLRTKVVFTVPFTAVPIITFSPIAGTGIGGNLVNINSTEFFLDIYGIGLARVDAGFTFIVREAV